MAEPGSEPGPMDKSPSEDSFLMQRRKMRLKDTLHIMEQGKSLLRKIARITLTGLLSFIRRIHVVETQSREGTAPGWCGLLTRKAENPNFQSCAFLPSLTTLIETGL